MAELIAALERYGLPLVFANVLLEQLGLPIPAVPALLAAGTLAFEGKLPLVSLVVLAVAASLIADIFWYYLGRRLGLRILRMLCKLSLSPDSCVRQTESYFERWGPKSLLVAKFIPGFSTVAPPLAAIAGTGLRTFLLLDAGGSLLWAGSSIAAGMVFHRAIDRIVRFLETFGFWALVATALVLFLYIAWKWWSRRRFYKFLRMARISVEELARLIEEKQDPLILDVRTPIAAAADPRKILGAVRVRLADLDEKLAEIPRDRDVILYCT